MPIIYKCKMCGYVLFTFNWVGQDFYGVRTPSELKAIIGEKCPKCGHELSTPTLEDIQIRKLKTPIRQEKNLVSERAKRVKAGERKV